ncbi:MULTISPECIES: hypothetical protein [Halorussus]|uniref:hypothetical protein n=1 Tax=Halorussus TaxID=1070314 RepID=UPI00209FE32F|nr:hypothetical protein [Halorussus vallis]USZ74699.1 hypothetical protein NGM07_14795 [Halorussus vallis]
MSDSEAKAFDELTEEERVAVEEVERGLEQFYRAHGALVEFHHAVGRAMEHFDAAEENLRGEHGDIADRLEDDVLPAGVTADGKLTYQVVAEFEEGLLGEVESVADEAFEELADGRRYPIERAGRGGRSNDS